MTAPYRQHVPRPPGGSAALPPPWRDAVGRAPSVPVSLVRAALRRPAPPRPARQAVEAAVLLACYPADGPAAGATGLVGSGLAGPGPGGEDREAMALLIRRSAHLVRDPGHVALPGGLVEAGEDPRAAALREAEEEVGLDPASVEVLGRLDTVERPQRGRAVAPFVGLLADRPVLTPSPDEVEAILEVPLAAFLAEGVAWEERWPLAGGAAGLSPARVVRFFACEGLGDDLVWGVTARILWDLLERVTAAAAEAGPGRWPLRPGRLD